jgi:hypothetical protein
LYYFLNSGSSTDQYVYMRLILLVTIADNCTSCRRGNYQLLTTDQRKDANPWIQIRLNSLQNASVCLPSVHNPCVAHQDDENRVLRFTLRLPHPMTLVCTLIWASRSRGLVSVRRSYSSSPHITLARSLEVIRRLVAISRRQLFNVVWR